MVHAAIAFFSGRGVISREPSRGSFVSKELGAVFGELIARWVVRGSVSSIETCGKTLVGLETNVADVRRCRRASTDGGEW